MGACVSCSSAIAEGSRFCPSCGSAVEISSENMTRTSAPPATPTSGAPLEGRFSPGTLLAGRYRIVGLVGRGGMGEVYRAEDLKLGQPVALKFLPAAVEKDPGRLSRFHDEVRFARQIAHPNVCRVYDIAESEGRHFLSMEYVDGEDLASLLRRIGRLPKDKAAQTARQICAGLAAAHDLGILHRDLKPANVMIDGRGRARITDFGLARLAEGIEQADIVAGTPSYMAPEQLAGKEVTVRSDLYSLGHVLYELFTGKPVFKASSQAELARLQAETTPSSPSSHVEGLDPAVERVILRCLEKDAKDRPDSALAVAAALPGGDPLAAALAAGETPSPEMVARAGDEGALQPARAAAFLALTLIGLAVIAFVSGRYGRLGIVPLPMPPEALEAKAREIIETLGYTEPPVDRNRRFWSHDSLLTHIERNDPSPGRWERLATDRPPAIGFEYRQSPRTMVPGSLSGRVTWRDPQFLISGMVSLDLDTEGRLWQFWAMPPHEDETSPPYDEPDWSVLLKAADLRAEDLSETRPKRLPETYCDRRAAWVGTYPDQPEPEIRVEACAFHGKPVYFEIVHPWSLPWRQQEFQPTAGERAQGTVGWILILSILAGAFVLARRNMLLGRGDRRGALRIAAFLVVVEMIAWLLQASHVPDLQNEMGLVIRKLGGALFTGAVAWLAYLALEPFVRRRWPESMIAWTRVLAGRLRDPRVGRDMLIGAVVGVGFVIVEKVIHLIPGWLGWAPEMPFGTDLDTLLGARWVAGELFYALNPTVLFPLLWLFLLVLLRVVLRREWLAAAAFVVLVVVMIGTLGANYPVLAAVHGLVVATVVYTTLVRFGLVATAMIVFFTAIDDWSPLTLDLSTWYADSTIAALLLVAAVAAYGFHVSLGGRKLLGDRLD